MKAISLHDPWATLVALKLKRFETRSWATKYRGPIAIHAAKTWGPVQRAAMHHQLICTALAKRGFWRREHFWPGCIIAVAYLSEVECMTAAAIDAMDDRERLFGDWRVGRYYWRLDDVRRLTIPVRVTGRQRLFDVPDSIALMR